MGFLDYVEITSKLLFNGATRTLVHNEHMATTPDEPRASSAANSVSKNTETTGPENWPTVNILLK